MKRLFSLHKKVAFAVLAVGMIFGNHAADAQSFPDRPVTLVLSSGSGSSVDVMARTLAKVAEQELGQPVVVSNKPGGDGAIAMTELLSKPADGYTLWAATKTFPVSINTNLKQFKVGDFSPLVRVQVDPFAIAVQASSPWKTLGELIAAGKGKPVNVGGFGSASPHGLFNYLLAKDSGSQLNWVPFQSGNKAITALLGGHLDAVISNPSSMMSQVKAGKLRILAVATEERTKNLPDVPTFRESGVSLVDSQWRGIFVKAGTPPEIVAKLDTAFKKAIASDEFQAYLVKTGQDDGYLGPKDFNAFVQSEIKIIEPVADDFQKGLKQ